MKRTWPWRRIATTTNERRTFQSGQRSDEPSDENWFVSLLGHFLGHPQSDAPAHQPKPNHEVVLPGALEARYRIPQQTRMHKESRNPRDGVMLRACVSRVRPSSNWTSPSSGWWQRETHISRDATDASEPPEAVLVLVGDQAAKHGVDVEGRLIRRQVVEGEPQARDPIRRV